jgi:hypothetical protein
MGTGGSFCGGKAAGAWSSPSANAELKKCGSIHLLPHTPSWRSAYLVKHGDNFTLLSKELMVWVPTYYLWSVNLLFTALVPTEGRSWKQNFRKNVILSSGKKAQLAYLGQPSQYRNVSLNFLYRITIQPTGLFISNGQLLNCTSLPAVTTTKYDPSPVFGEDNGGNT